MERPTPVELTFPDYPTFRPNLTPRQMFEAGIFGGSYFRPIRSAVTGLDHANEHVNCTSLKGLPARLLCNPKAIPKENKYKVLAGSSLEEWEVAGWIVEQDPYGWVQWYVRFYEGRRSPGDARQIDRWNKFAGPKSGRFRTQLINKIKAAGGDINNVSISPVVRQGLLQWGYELTQADYDAKLKK
jgi:hypothetical protein